MAIGPENMVEVRNLTKSYGGNAPAIRDISLTLKRGEFVVLLGPSGVGKSMVCRHSAHIGHAAFEDVAPFGRKRSRANCPALSLHNPGLSDQPGEQQQRQNQENQCRHKLPQKIINES